MNIGERIRRIRNLRGLTQNQLGQLIGFDESNAYKRIMQYETGYRVPRIDIINKLASALDVNPLAISSTNNDSLKNDFLDDVSSKNNFEDTNSLEINSLEAMMYNLFKIEEEFKFKISIIKSVNESGEEIEKVALVSDSEIFKNLAEEWVKRREELEKGTISEDEYLEWQINWPQTCDNFRVSSPKKWRRD